MSRFWLFISIPAAVVAIWLLVKTILHMLRSTRAAVVATVPIRAEQQITFENAGGYVLSWEAPLHARQIVSINGQLPFNLGYVLSRADPPYVARLFLTRSQVYVNSLTRSRTQLLTFDLPFDGPYTLQINGIDSSVDYSHCAIVISRPIGFTIVSHVVAILILTFASLGSIIFTSLLIARRI